VGDSPGVTARSGFALAPRQVLSFPHGLQPGGPHLWAVTADGGDASVSVGPVCEHGAGLLAEGRDGAVAESAGTRLGRMMAAEPELTQVQPSEFIRRFVAYVTADGFDCSSMVTRMERLKFETIVQEKSYSEVLAESEDQ